MTVKELKDIIDSESDETIVYFTLGQMVVALNKVEKWNIDNVKRIEIELTSKRIDV